MIPYSSCMCFGRAERATDRRRPWRLLTVQKGTELIFERSQDNSLCIRVKNEEEKEVDEKRIAPLRNSLSTSETSLLQAVMNQKPTPLSSGVQVVGVSGRRTRQPVITPVISRHLLDDAYAGVTEILLSKCGRWEFNTFNLDVATGGKSLSFLLVHLFHEYGFVNHFKLDVVKVWRCFNLMESAYHRHNPYHNSVHAADVTQAMHCFLQENKFSAHLTPLEAMTAVIAAVAHDLDHPGVTHTFLVATSNHLVELYRGLSVLENHHWRTAISCLRESGVFDHLGRDVWLDIQSQIRSLILATDIQRQREFLTNFQKYLRSKSLDMENTQCRHFALQIALKCADLCNPCRPWAISQRWSYQVCQEFYRQGAYERQLQLPLTPTFDCSRTKVAKIQADFFLNIVSPLFETWDHFLETPLSNQLLTNLRHNYSQWRQRMELMQQQLQDTGGILEEDEDRKDGEAPQIQVESSPSPHESDLQSPTDPIMASPNLLTPSNSDVVIKQHRSKSDSGLTPRLLSPNFTLETYSTEELHPSTTLLSLSSTTNTVQLRKAYATTKVESHLICPTVFQPPLLSNFSPKRQQVSESSECPSDAQELCSGPGCKHPSAIEQVLDSKSPTSSADCPDGCCSPVLHDRKHECEKSGCSGDPREDENEPKTNALYSKTDSHFHHQSSVMGVRNSSSSSTNRTMASNRTDFGRSSLGTPGQSVYLSRPTTAAYLKKHSLPETDETLRMTQSWCWHISRSLSAERPVKPSHDFDSPSPSWQGSCSSLAYGRPGGRRASAPVAVNGVGSSQWSSLGDMVDPKGGLRGGAEISALNVRRWSIPTEPMSGLLLSPDRPDYMDTRNIVKETVRRHSFGLLEPFLSMPSSESENDGSSTGPTSTGTTCSTRRNSSAVGQRSRKRYMNQDVSDPDEGPFNSSEMFLPCFPASPQAPSRRRGSLPAEIPIALVRHVASPSRRLSAASGFEDTRRADSVAGCSRQHSSGECVGGGGHHRLWEHSRRHGSPSDLLSVLIGPAGMLTTMHGMVYCRTAGDWQRSSAQDYTRRRSGGLEMLSGLWRSRTCDPPLAAGLVGRVKLQRQLDDWAMRSRGEDALRSPLSPSRSSGVSGLSQQLLYQQRRGSVPLDVSLLSLSSGNTYSGDQGD